VLLVDDDREITRGLMYRLRAKGYTVETAHGGNEGLAAVATCNPDAIILDIRMPDIDGLTVLSKLKADAQTSQIPVIMCSASLVDRKDALDLGASFFVQKPFDAAAIVAAIGAVSPGPEA
jgi:DNA-binding response OmpR family regulator